MAKSKPCAKYQYVLTPAGPKIIPVPDAHSKDEESPADYNSGGYLPVKVRDTFKDGRYLVLRKLGWGHFSTVWLVKDTLENRHGALKVVKSAGRYAETARDEIKLLRQVMDANPAHPGRNHIVSFLDSFQHCAPEDVHVCLVFEPLGENLLALIERNKATGVPPPLVKFIAKQVLLGLQYLHDECDLVHTDIKPENIMISIPDVESHIQAELSLSPSPTSRKVGVPPKPARPGIAIPRRANNRGSERHVQIFDSQPLSSPSPTASASSSPSTKFAALMMSRTDSEMSVGDVVARSSVGGSLKGVLKDAKDKMLGKGKAKSKSGGEGSKSKQASADSNASTPSDVSSGPSTLSFGTMRSSEGTPATSLGSVEGALEKMTLVTEPESPRCTCTSEAARDAEEDVPGADAKQDRGKAPHVGPSLLSQTAPSGLRHRCETHAPSSGERSRSRSSGDAKHASAPPSPARTSSSSSLSSSRSLSSSYPISIKIADLGNATPTRRHYTEDIQTRQYRSPEAILGRTDWGATADVWSVACVVFELLTAEYLFDPQAQGDVFGKDDDHVAQIVELCGEFGEWKWGGRWSREIFDSEGNLRYIRNLKPWPLHRVMVEKYLWSEEDSRALCAFLEPMLVVDHTKRKRAGEMVDHPWLEVGELSGADLGAW